MDKVYANKVKNSSLPKTALERWKRKAALGENIYNTYI